MKEIVVPIAMKEVLKDGGKQFVVCRAQVPLVTEEAYVEGDVHRAPKPILALVGQLVWFPLPSGSKYAKDAVCGILASQVDPTGTPLWSSPMSGVITGEFEPGELTIAPMTSAVAQFTPELPALQVECARFKHFDLQVKSGDSKKIFITDLRIGVQAIGMSEQPIPFWVANRKDAFSSSINIVPGVLFSITISNTGSEPVVIAGNIVFEEVVISKTGTPKTVAPRN